MILLLFTLAFAGSPEVDALASAIQRGLPPEATISTIENLPPLTSGDYVELLRAGAAVITLQDATGGLHLTTEEQGAAESLGDWKAPEKPIRPSASNATQRPIPTAGITDLDPGTGLPANVEQLKFQDGGVVMIEMRQPWLSLYLADGDSGVSFNCKSWGEKQWENYPLFLEKLSDNANAHPNADFGAMLSGMLALQTSNGGVDYCDARAQTKNGTIIVTYIHNSACFGSAGCNNDYVSFALSPSEVASFANAIREHL